MEYVTEGENGWKYYSDGKDVYETQQSPTKDPAGKGLYVDTDMAIKVPGTKNDYLPWYNREGDDKKTWLKSKIDKGIDHVTSFVDALSPIMKGMNTLSADAVNNIFGDRGVIHPTQSLLATPMAATKSILEDMLIGRSEEEAARQKTTEMLDVIDYKTTFEGLINEDQILKNLPKSEKLTMLKLYKQLIDLAPTVSKQSEIVRNIFRTAASIGSTSLDPQTAQSLLKMEDYFGRIKNNAKGIIRRTSGDDD